MVNLRREVLDQWFQCAALLTPAEVLERMRQSNFVFEIPKHELGEGIVHHGGCLLAQFVDQVAEAFVALDAGHSGVVRGPPWSRR